MQLVRCVLLLLVLLLIPRAPAHAGYTTEEQFAIYAIKTRQAQALKQKNFSLYASFFDPNCQFVDQTEPPPHYGVKGAAGLNKHLQMLKRDLSGGTVTSSYFTDFQAEEVFYITLKTANGGGKIIYYNLQDHAWKRPGTWKLYNLWLIERRVLTFPPAAPVTSILGKWVEPDRAPQISGSMRNLREAQFFADGTLSLTLTDNLGQTPSQGLRAAGNWRQLDAEHLRVEVNGITEVWGIDHAKLLEFYVHPTEEQLRQAGLLLAYYSSQPRPPDRLTLTDGQNQKHYLMR